MESAPEHMRYLQAHRDLATSLYRIMAKFAFPHVLDVYTIDGIKAHDPLRKVMMVYFPHADPAQIQRISDTLWNAFFPHLAQMQKFKNLINGDWKDQRKSFKMDHDLWYVMCMTLLHPLQLQANEITKLYPTTLTESDMWE